MRSGSSIHLVCLALACDPAYDYGEEVVLASESAEVGLVDEADAEFAAAQAMNYEEGIDESIDPELPHLSSELNAALPGDAPRGSMNELTTPHVAAESSCPDGYGCLWTGSYFSGQRVLAPLNYGGQGWKTFTGYSAKN